MYRSRRVRNQPRESRAGTPSHRSLSGVGLLVVGATGGLGRLAVAQAVERGHDVSALVRDPLATTNLPEGVLQVRGDIFDPASLAPAVDGRDWVICTLGTPSPRKASNLLEEGTRNLIEAMKRSNVKRLVCVTLLGTTGSKHNASPFYRHVILRVLAPMLPDKENQERVVRESGLEWVLVRPPRFVNGRGRRLRVLRTGERGRVGHVARQQLASFLIDASEGPDYVHEAIVVGS